MEKVAERARSIIRTQLGMRETEPIGLDARIADLGADDLDNVEIILALEEEFECAIPDDVAARLTPGRVWAATNALVRLAATP
jgi:acyl carrier protein